jgi:hypothetical protein
MMRRGRVRSMYYRMNGVKKGMNEWDKKDIYELAMWDQSQASVKRAL